MTQETKTDRKTRLARERKRNQRQREKGKRLVMGATTLKMEIYSGTQRELEQIRTVGQFDQTDEALTLTIHGMAELSRRDPAAFHALVKPRTS